MSSKAEIRKEFLLKRKSLTPAQVADYSQQVFSQFQRFFQTNQVSTVHTFLTIKKYNELDTWPIIEFLQSQNVKIVVSKSDFKDHTLHHYQLEKTTVLVENSWGIPEPKEAEPVSTKSIEMVLVPLVAIDQLGFRIGYGKGFYDKFLAECPSKLLKVGLSLFPAIENIYPNTFDVKMDHCILPDKILNF